MSAVLHATGGKLVNNADTKRQPFRYTVHLLVKRGPSIRVQ